MAADTTDVMIRDMARASTEFRAFEGRQVSVALADGSRLDDCSLVSAGRGATKTLWLVIDRIDAFLPMTDVVAIWEPVQ
jgi:hypothetical protein